MPSAHIDTFARDRLPPPHLMPEFLFELPELRFPAQLNCAHELLDRHVAEGRGDEPGVAPDRLVHRGAAGGHALDRSDGH